MVKENRIFIFVIVVLCIVFLGSVCVKKAICQNSISSNISFSADSNSICFLDRDEAKLYRYNMQGKVTRIYIIKELGKDLVLK